MNSMRYFSTFSGIGGFELGILDNFPDAECVGYSEIDKYPIQVYEKHFPNHNNYGDISQIDIENLPDFDLLVGGFPCQDLSIAKKDREGLDGERSGLFWVLVDIIKIKKPKYFVLENVASMPKKDKEIISEVLGVEPVMINAALVSAQNRKRLFWCNFPVDQPEDRGVLLKDILQPPAEVDERMVVSGKSYSLTASYNGAVAWNSIAKKQRTMVRVGHLNKGGQGDRIYNTEGKSVNLSANGGGRGATKESLLLTNTEIRKLTPIECARLQCFPDDWCEGLSNTRQYKAYGNAVNVEVVKHIFKQLKENE